MKNTPLVLVGILVIVLGFLLYKDSQIEKDPVDSMTPVANVAENPEGEADPSVMKLEMNKWVWVEDNKFTISFDKSRFSVTTDCNSMSGSYATNPDTKFLAFAQVISTKMYCEGSREVEFAQILENVDKYHFTSRGELILGFRSGGGSATFR